MENERTISIGVIVQDPYGKVIDGVVWNVCAGAVREAECQAIHQGIRLLDDWGVAHGLVESDSKVGIEWITTDYNFFPLMPLVFINCRHMIKRQQTSNQLRERKLIWTRRDLNKEADELANLARLHKLDEIFFSIPKTELFSLFFDSLKNLYCAFVSAEGARPKAGSNLMCYNGNPDAAMGVQDWVLLAGTLGAG